jgi:hypothetical protein
MPQKPRLTYSDPKVILSVIGGLLLLGFLFSLETNRNKEISTPKTAEPKVSEAAKVQPSAPATWHDITTIKGRGMKKTESFSIPSNEWRITWVTQPGQYGAMNFQIYVYSADGILKDVAANVIGKDEDSTIMRGSGSYYLDINTAQPYVIKIEAKY